MKFARRSTRIGYLGVNLRRGHILAALFALGPRIAPSLNRKAGFAHKAIGLSFVTSDKLKRLISVDEDLAHSGVKKVLPSMAEYFRSYLCRSCELYLIDYGTAIRHAQAKELLGRD